MQDNVFNKEIKIKGGLLALLVIALIGSTSVIGILIQKGNSDIIISKQDEILETPKIDKNTNNGADTKKVEQTESIEEIKIYVVGEVKKPGVVTMKKGQIIKDAIDLAGGTTDKADIENINMVFELQENLMLRVWSKADRQARQDKASDGGQISANGVGIIKNSGGAVVEEKKAEENSKGLGGKVNINTASAEELNSLPGVGPSTAAKIISFREQTGKFNKVEDLMEVTGIGESKFNSLKDFITIK
jgi:competence protein ComEA